MRKSARPCAVWGAVATEAQPAAMLPKRSPKSGVLVRIQFLQKTKRTYVIHSVLVASGEPQRGALFVHLCCLGFSRSCYGRHCPRPQDVDLQRTTCSGLRTE